MLGYDITNKSETESTKTAKLKCLPTDISQRMERHACVRALKKFKDSNDLNIVEFVVDYSKSVITRIEEEMPEIHTKLRLDKWHIIKNIQKNAREVS